MNSRPALTLGAMALLALGFSAPALAQPSEAQMAAIKQNCRSDYMAKCMSVKPGGPEAFQCLKRNEASLSAACKTAVNAINTASGGGSPPAQEAKPAPAPAPAAPAQASPASASPPPATAAPAAAPAVAAAPAAPKPAASKPATPAAAPAAQPSAAQQNAIKQNCRNDFMAHCAGVQPGGAEALNCLKTNTAKLAPACKSAVAAIGGAPAAQPAVAAATPPAAAAPAAPPAALPAPRLDSPMEARIIREFCFNDFRVLCRGVRPGQGRALQCLATNAPALSPGCKAAMAQASR